MFDTPGVYLKEIAVGPRPISGVSTSNTAFVGVFKRGPVNKPVRITSLSEFERVFGGAWMMSDASQSVRSYFLNGGAVAFIVRVDNGTNQTPLSTAKKIFKTTGDGNAATDAMTVSASSQGDWGNQIRIGIAVEGDAFSLLIREYAGKTIVREEVFEGLSASEAGASYVESVINGVSELVTIAHTDAKMPAATVTQGTAGAKTLDDLLKLEPNKLEKLADGKNGITPLDNKGVPNTAWVNQMNGSLVGAADGAGGPKGLYALNGIVPDTFNLLCLPDAAAVKASDAAKTKQVYEAAESYCRDTFAFLLVDTPRSLARDKLVSDWISKLGAVRGANAACYYPRLSGPNPVDPAKALSLATSGAVAGLFARTDSNDGVWRAAAGTDAMIAGGNPEVVLTDRQHGPVNLAGVNAIRTLPIYGNVIMGARTMDGVAGRGSPSTYVSVRRLTLFIEASLKQGLMWVPFEPNDENTWSNIRLAANAFMSDLHQRGAFQGASARDAYLVKCGADTTNQNDINRGIVNIIVGFQPVQPIEFVVVNIQIGMQRN